MTSLPVLQPVEYGFFPLQLPWLQLAAAAGPAVTNRAAATSATAPRTAPRRRRIRLPNRCWPDVQPEDMTGPFADALGSAGTGHAGLLGHPAGFGRVPVQRIRRTRTQSDGRRQRPRRSSCSRAACRVRWSRSARLAFAILAERDHLTRQ